MKITIAKSTLVTALDRCARVADRRSTMPILANVLIDAAGPRVAFAATDLYLSTTTHLDTKVDAPGSVALPARDLLARVKAMPDGEIRIVVDGEAKTTVSAVGASRRFVLHGVAGEEFPAVAQPGAITHALTSTIVRRLLAETAYAISTDETRLHLNSLLVEFGPEGLTAVATDGHRLAWSRVADTSWKPTTWLVPLKGVLELKRIAADSEDDLDFSVADRTLFVTQDKTTFGVKLVDAQFPPYQQVIPKESSATIRVSRTAFADSLRAVSLSASDRTGGVKLCFGGDGTLRIQSESAEGGEGFDEIASECSYNAVIGVNARYVLDVLGALECDDVLLGVSGELDPVTIKVSEPGAGAEFGGVIMPMRI